MSSIAASAFRALILSFTTTAFLSACSDNDDQHGAEAEAGMGGTVSVAGGGGRGGSSGGKLGAGSAGSPDGADSAGKGGATAGTAGRAATSSGGTGSPQGEAGSAGRPPGDTGHSPYEIECRGETVSCGDPASLLCLGLRVETEVFGYSCSNECDSSADCSALPASTDAAPACVDFVNKKYCMLVCHDHDERASCPTGMACYTYQGAAIGYCLWR